MKQPELAEALGVSVETMSRMENGRTRVEEGVMGRIADICGVPLSFMQRGFEAVTEAEEAARVNGAANDLEDVLRRVAALEQATGLQ